MPVIQRHNIVLPLVHPPEIPDQNSTDRPEENTVRGHEIQETAGAGQDLPGNHDPSDDGAEELPPTNIDVGGEKSGEVVGGGETVGRNIDAQSRESESEAGEEATRAIRPQADQGGGVPLQRAVLGERGRSGSDAAEGDEGEDDGEHGHVEPLPFDAGAAVAGEVGHVDGEGGVVADDGGEGGQPGVGVGGAADGGFGGGGEENAAGAVGGAEGPD